MANGNENANGKRAFHEFIFHIISALVIAVVGGFITGVIWKTHMDDWVASIEKHVEANDKRLDKAELQREWLDERIDAIERKEHMARPLFQNRSRPWTTPHD